MFEGYLVPENTTITAKGEGQPVDISSAHNRVFLLLLAITKQVEQEALDLAIFGSPDGATWGAKPLLSFPQKFYTGDTPLLLDLREQPDVRYLRAHWDATRWGRGSETPMFTFAVKLTEVEPGLLSQVTSSR
jgi:hypothetical protein